MPLTAHQFLADVAALYIRVPTPGTLGSGRLIAPGLVLTSGHVTDYPTREASARTGWKVSLLRERIKDGAWADPHAAELLWRGPGDLDLALLRVIGDPTLTPTLKPVFASYDLLEPIAEVDAAGFPEAWFTEKGSRSREYRVRGTLRIATQNGPYTLRVPAADEPDDPHGWKGMSGAAVCLVGPGDNLYLFGAVQEVPANFSGGLLQVARLSDGLANADFLSHLQTALGEEPHVVPWEGRGPTATGDHHIVGHYPVLLPSRAYFGDPFDFEDFSRKLRMLRDADNLFGPEQMMPLVDQQLARLRKLSDGTRGVDRQRLLQVQAQFADLYAWLHQDTCNCREAQYWLDRALDWSLITDDSEAIAFILARKSQVAAELNDATNATDVAGTAIRRACSRHWRAATSAATYAAHGYALQGNRSACQRMYDLAYEFLDKIEPDPNAPYGLFLNAGYINVQRAHSLAALGENAMAAEAFGKAIGTLPEGYRRDRGIYFVRKALAHEGAEEAEQAATTGWQALVIGAETRSVRIINGLTRLHKALSRWNRVPCVAEFQRALIDEQLIKRTSNPAKEASQ